MSRDARPVFGPLRTRLEHVEAVRDGLAHDRFLPVHGASGNVLAVYEWSDYGVTLFARYPESAIDQDVFLVDPEDREVRQLFNTSAFEADGSVSPDGQWLAYASTFTGRWEVYITSLVPSGNTKVVTNGGGVDPRWSRSGRELYYVHSVTGELMAVDVSTDAGVIGIGEPRRIYAGPLKWGSVHSFAPVPPDETRFLVWTHDPDPGDITVLLGWDRRP